MLDSIDRRLLGLLQQNAHLTANELGEALNLSASQAGRRRQRLEAEGYIRAYAAKLDAARLVLLAGGRAFREPADRPLRADWSR